MAPVCQAEESLSAHFEALLNNQTEAEVGVINWSVTDFILV